jgi:hypothetical protein
MEYYLATKHQLITICLHEDCSFDHKYEACRELQLQQWQEDMLPDLVKLWGQGLDIFTISIELGITEHTVKNKLKKYGLYGKRQNGIKRARTC